MVDSESLTRLQGLHTDLIAFAESRLPNLERLWAELEDSIAEFKQLLDHKTKSDQSRRDIGGDKLTLDDVEYAINEEFRQQAVQVADELDLDEVDSARLVLEAQEEALALGRPPAIAAIYQYHGRREALLGSLRLAFQQAQDVDIDAETRQAFGQLVQLVVQEESGKPSSGKSYWTRCHDSMVAIEAAIRRIRDRLHSISVIGETINSPALEALEYQQASLLRQHESLGGITCTLVKLGHTVLSDYQAMLKALATIDTFDELVVHYVPVLIAFAATYGPSDGSATLRDARGFDQNFSDKSDSLRWKLPDFRSAASVWWLAEYSGRYADGVPSSPIQGVNLDAENDTRSDRVMDSLREGAFQFMLLICSKIKAQLWHDPAKTGLIAYLLGNHRAEHQSPLMVNTWFEELLSDQLQIFIEALISNMPDTIRRLKAEEDDHRRNVGISLSLEQAEDTLHLERFLTIISYAFSGSPDQALEAFWSDPDGNMYGFLQWASKRQSTPRAAAFSEMFQAIAESDECAEAAHRFLLDEAVGASSAKLRRGVSLSWSQIFSELAYYADRLRESPSALINYHDSSMAALTMEPESALMLECYLRLTSYMCRNSTAAREYLLANQDVRIHEVLLDLCRSGIESRFKACAFTTLASILTNKSMEVSYGMWEALDAWTCGVSASKTSSAKTANNQTNIDAAISSRLRLIASGFEEANAFVRLVQTLVELPVDQSALNDALAFPEQLGASYRMAGIDQYVDFAFGSVMTGVLPVLENDQQILELRCACLDFTRTALSSFNEDLVIFANTTNVNVDTAMATTSLANYVKLHPFARIMEWMFNDAVINQLFASAHADPDVLAASPADSPLVTSVARAIQVIDLIMRLQGTYLDIVRPIVKLQSGSRSRQVANPTLASFEDAVVVNLSIVVDLGLYCSTGFEHLTSLSLSLLQRLATSRKLAGSAHGFSDGRPQLSRVLAALQQAGDVDRIEASLVAPLQVDPREMEFGVEAPGYAIKVAILELLDKSLALNASRAGLAHCLLGFTCTDRAISVSSEGRFSQGISVFHAIARLYAETAAPEQIAGAPWLATIRSKASEILRRLLRSPLTSTIVLSQLRDSGYNQVVAVSQLPIAAIAQLDPPTEDFDAAEASSSAILRAVLVDRVSYFEHQALELRHAALSKSLSLQTKVTSSLLGLTSLPSGEQIQHTNVFDLFDFFEDDIFAVPELPSLKHMGNLAFAICKTEDSDGLSSYDLRLVRELLLLREAELRQSGQLGDEYQLQQAQLEADTVLAYLSAENQSLSLKAKRTSACLAWVQLITVMLSDASLESVQKSAFILQALQVILPRVDVGLAHESANILPLVKLVYTLLVAHSASATQQTDPIFSDRLFVSLGLALTSVTSSVDSPDLREISYKIISHVMTSTSSPRNVRKAIESAGDRVLDMLTEDALSSTSTIGVSALLVLDGLVNLYTSQSASAKLIASLTRLNLVQSLLDALRAIPASFAEPSSAAEAVTRYLSATLSVLVRLARDAKGADALLDHGLFAAVRDSGLCAADPDPDPGDDADDTALQRYYALLAGVLRVVGAVVLVKGGRNDAVMARGRAFVAEGRAGLVAALKAERRGEGGAAGAALREVVKGWVVVCAAVGFCEFDDAPKPARRLAGTFT